MALLRPPRLDLIILMVASPWIPLVTEIDAIFDPINLEIKRQPGRSHCQTGRPRPSQFHLAMNTFDLSPLARHYRSISLMQVKRTDGSSVDQEIAAGF